MKHTLTAYWGVWVGLGWLTFYELTAAFFQLMRKLGYKWAERMARIWPTISQDNWQGQRNFHLLWLVVGIAFVLVYFHFYLGLWAPGWTDVLGGGK